MKELLMRPDMLKAVAAAIVLLALGLIFGIVLPCIRFGRAGKKMRELK